MTQTKRTVGFGGGLLIFITVLLTMLFVALAFLWHYLACFEGAREEGVMDRYMTETLTTQLQEQIHTYSVSRQTGYQSAQEVSDVLTEALSGDDWHYERSVARSGSNRLVYDLYKGELVVGEAELPLAEGGLLDMGFDTWQAPQVTFDFAQFGKSVTVIAPFGCEVYISGEQLGQDNVTETIGLYPQLDAYEAYITDPNQLLVYEVDEVFTEIAVEFNEGYNMVRPDGNMVYGLPVCDNELAESLIENCKSFVRAYVDCDVNGKALWTVQQYLVPDSDLYQEVTDAFDGGHRDTVVNAKVEAVDVKNFVYYGNVITCDANYTVMRDDGNRSETMQILMVNTIFGWRVMTRTIFENVRPSPEAVEGA